MYALRRYCSLHMHVHFVSVFYLCPSSYFRLLLTFFLPTVLQFHYSSLNFPFRWLGAMCTAQLWSKRPITHNMRTKAVCKSNLHRRAMLDCTCARVCNPQCRSSRALLVTLGCIDCITDHAFVSVFVFLQNYTRTLSCVTGCSRSFRAGKIVCVKG